MRTKNSKYASSSQRNSTSTPHQSSAAASSPSSSVNVNKNSISSDSELAVEDQPQWTSRHPETWTREEVGEWIDWCTSEFSLPKIAKGKHFEMNGRGLLMLTVDMFKQRAPGSGDILFSALTSLLPTDQQLKRQSQQDSASKKSSPQDFSLLEIKGESKQSASHLHPDPGASTTKSINSTTTATSGLSQACTRANANHQHNSKPPKPPTTTTTHVIAQRQAASSSSSASNHADSSSDELCTTEKTRRRSPTPPPTLSSSSASNVSPSKRTRSNSSSFAEPPAAAHSEEKEMKETAILSSFVSNQSNCKENERLKDLDVDELKLANSIKSEANSNEINQRKRHLSPSSTVMAAVAAVAAASPASNVERKRTLENLVDTLKVRKQNQTSPSGGSGAYKSAKSGAAAGADGGQKMSSIYVDIAASMSDCSPSTPPLSSSPSVSPSSLSIPPDSPGHVSSYGSSTSSVANLINQALVAAAVNRNHRNVVMPKSRWLFDFASEIGVVVTNESDATAAAAVSGAGSNAAKSSSSSSSSSSYTASSSKSSSPSSSTLNSNKSSSSLSAAAVKRVAGVNSSSAAGGKTGGAAIMQHHHHQTEKAELDEELEQEEDIELDKDEEEELEDEFGGANQADWNNHNHNHHHHHHHMHHNQTGEHEQMDDDEEHMASMMGAENGEEPELNEYADEIEDEVDEELDDEEDDDSFVDKKAGKGAASAGGKGRGGAGKLKGAAGGARGGVGKAGQADSKVKFYDDYIDFKGDILRRPPNSKNCRILWEYLYLLLQNTNYTSVIRWEDEDNMVFRIVQAEKLASLWGLQKNRLGMTYEKLSRGMRYYYPNNIIAREPGRRLLYRFMRHPDEIKKFVKKDGKYMLKRAKGAGKNGDASAYDDDVSFDEETGRLNDSSKRQLTKKTAEAAESSVKASSISNIIKFNKKLGQQQQQQQQHNDNKGNHSKMSRGGGKSSASKFGKDEYDEQPSSEQYGEDEYDEANEANDVDENNNYVNENNNNNNNDDENEEDEDDAGNQSAGYNNGSSFYQQQQQQTSNHSSHSSNSIFEHYKQNFKPSFGNGDNSAAVSQLARFMPDLAPLYQQIMAAAAAHAANNLQPGVGSYMSQQQQQRTGDETTSLASQLLYHMRNQQQQQQAADSATSSTSSSSSSNGAINGLDASGLASQFLLNETIKNFSNSINLQRPQQSGAGKTNGASSNYHGQSPMTGAAAASLAAKQKRLNAKQAAASASSSSTTSSTSSSKSSSYDLRDHQHHETFLNAAKQFMQPFGAGHLGEHPLNLSAKKRKSKNDIN